MIENAKPHKRGFWPTFGDLKGLVSNEDWGSGLTAIQMKKQFWNCTFLDYFWLSSSAKQNENVNIVYYSKRQKMEKPKKIFAVDDVIWSVPSSQLKKRSSNPEKSQF